MPALEKLLESVFLGLWLGSTCTKILLSRRGKSILFVRLYSVIDPAVLVDVPFCCKS